MTAPNATPDGLVQAIREVDSQISARYADIRELRLERGELLRTLVSVLGWGAQQRGGIARAAALLDVSATQVGRLLAQDLERRGQGS